MKIEDIKACGSVQFYCLPNAYGFIKTSSGSIFFHKKALTNCKVPHHNDVAIVTEFGENHIGRCAKKVTIIKNRCQYGKRNKRIRHGKNVL